VISSQIQIHHSFGSGNLAAKRNVAIYLPPGYFDGRDRRFPTLYMQDGQNLFDPAASFAGVAWHADETAQELTLKKKIQPLIIIAVGNTSDRTNEYTPVISRGRGGRADEYGRWLIEELKPFIDANYRTLPGREFTGVGGSSLGGLFALHMGFTRPDIFGRIAAMSPSAWWANAKGVIFSHRLACCRTFCAAKAGRKTAARCWRISVTWKLPKRVMTNFPGARDLIKC
jgi:predicted alpha/beta superfamily hydrolase